MVSQLPLKGTAAVSVSHGGYFHTQSWPKRTKVLKYSLLSKLIYKLKSNLLPVLAFPNTVDKKTYI